MLTRLPPLLLCLALLCRAEASPAQEPQVTWGMAPWPGLVSVRDGQPDGGIVVELLRSITSRLPGYQHRYSLVNLSRGLDHLRRESLSCLLPIFRTAERDRVGHYVGLFVAMPHQLVIRRSDRERFLAPELGAVSLRQLLLDRHLSGGLLRDRSYGPMLDPLLHDAGLQRIQSSDAGHNLLRMLEHRRIDYLLEYAEVLQYVQHQGEARELIQLPLQEAGEPQISGIYCSRNAAGAELVRAVDRIARKPQVVREFRQAQGAYLPAATLQHYQAWLDSFFADRSQHDLTSLAP